MNNLLFQTPWWLPTGLILLGIAVFWSSNKRRQREAMLGGLALVLAGIAIATISYFVDTDQEKAVRRVDQIVQAVNDRNWNGLKQLLQPQTSIYGFRGPEQITNVIQTAAERYNIGSSKITGTDIQQNDTLLSINIRIFTQGAMFNGVSDWRFSFQDLGRGYELRQIEALPSAEQDPARIQEALKHF